MYHRRPLCYQVALGITSIKILGSESSIRWLRHEGNIIASNPPLGSKSSNKFDYNSYGLFPLPDSDLDLDSDSDSCTMQTLWERDLNVIQ